jgi:hypothetical protein
MFVSIVTWNPWKVHVNRFQSCLFGSYKVIVKETASHINVTDVLFHSFMKPWAVNKILY